MSHTTQKPKSMQLAAELDYRREYEAAHELRTMQARIAELEAAAHHADYKMEGWLCKQYPLEACLYPESKDWVEGDYRDRVELLHTMCESVKSEVEQLKAKLRAIGIGGVGQSIQPPVQADTVLPVSVPTGWKLVPVKHTLDMSIAFAETWYSERCCIDDPDMQDAWQSMIDAAPEAPAAQQAPVAGARCKIIDNCKSCQHSAGRQSCMLANRAFEGRERPPTPPDWCPLPLYAAPRVTPADIDANIVKEVYFTAADGILGASISTDDISTLINTEHTLLTFCVLTLCNGFTVTGESACASPENFDAEIGRKIARQNAISKVWSLMGMNCALN